MNPATPEHFKINVIYTVSSVIQLILTYASTKFRKQSGNLLFVVYQVGTLPAQYLIVQVAFFFLVKTVLSCNCLFSTSGALKI